MSLPVRLPEPPSTYTTCEEQHSTADTTQRQGKRGDKMTFWCLSFVLKLSCDWRNMSLNLVLFNSRGWCAGEGKKTPKYMSFSTISMCTAYPYICKQTTFLVLKTDLRMWNTDSRVTFKLLVLILISETWLEWFISVLWFWIFLQHYHGNLMW